jgi:pyroglutamyl-peptidase
MILVTAFEPFGGETINPTARVLAALPEEIGGCKLHKLLLPVEFLRCREIAAKEYDALKPAAVIMLGQHGGADAINVETTAVNRMHAFAKDGTPRPDNAGFAPENEPLTEGGADRLFSTFPAEEIARAVSAAGVRCELSQDAGRYVCNALLYGMLNHNEGEVPTGFLHVPYLKEQGHEDKPFMELDAMVRGITAAIRAVEAGLE